VRLHVGSTRLAGSVDVDGGVPFVEAMHTCTAAYVLGATAAWTDGGWFWRVVGGCGGEE